MVLICRLWKDLQSTSRFIGVRTTVIILAGFSISTVPMSVLATMEDENFRGTPEYLVFFDVCSLFLYSGPIINTVIYGSTNVAFKKALSKRCTSLFSTQGCVNNGVAQLEGLWLQAVLQTILHLRKQ